MAFEEVVNLSLRRGIFFPTAEIYGSAISGFYDLGPVGCRMANNIVSFWRSELVEREGFAEMCGCTILPESVFSSSGHLDSFNDPIVQCSSCSSFFRADKLVEDATGKKIAESSNPDVFDSEILSASITCPKCGGRLGKTKVFNMMVGTRIGPEGKISAYLRPETCQNIFVSFKRIFSLSRNKLPLGVAQTGRAYRNEISPRNALIRLRELRQMEIEVFFDPESLGHDFSDYERSLKVNLFSSGKSERILLPSMETSGPYISHLLASVWRFFSLLGFPNEKMRFRYLEKDDRPFYSKNTWDLEVLTSGGWVELAACNNRQDYDLSSHSRGSGAKLEVSVDGRRFVPHVFEISIGLDRTLFSLIDVSLRKEHRGSSERTILSIPRNIAPYRAAVFPLVNKDGIYEKAMEIFSSLGGSGVLFDSRGSIGKRYARVDEIGVPIAITVDYQTLEDDTVTVRDRDTAKQKRVGVPSLKEEVGFV